jgi:hypothetical protein
MNTVELADALTGRKWEHFAAKLKKSMGDYPLTGVTVILREMTAEEIANETDGYVLTFNHELQKFEVAVDSSRSFPAAWQIADTIDHFLNPDEDNAESTLEGDQ